MKISKFFKEKNYLNTIAIFRLGRIKNNLYFFFRYLFFKKKMKQNLKDSFSKRKFKTADGKSIEIFENIYEKLPDNFFADSIKMKMNKKIKEFLPSVDFIFDIGANIGFWAVAQKVFYNQDTKIYCFEPSKLTFEILKKNVNKHDDIEIYNYALGDKDCYQTLSLPIDAVQEGLYYSVGHYTLKNKSLFFGEKVQVYKFDTIFEKEFSKNINLKNSGVFIKIDCEGSELDFINGAFETLKVLNNVIFQIEFNKKIFNFSKENYISNFEKRIELLKNAGFKKLFYKDRNHEFQLLNINDIDLNNVFENPIKLHKTNKYKHVYVFDFFFSK